MDKTKQAAVFFDRDGVLNHDTGYIHLIEDFCWIKGAKEAIALCQQKGYYVFVVTNQSGIARGLYTEKEVELLHNYMQKELEKIGAIITEFAYCPHHPEGVMTDYAKNCLCRKPQPGMILQLIEKYHVDTEKSFLIGDRDSDMEAAKNAGIRSYLFNGLDIYSFVSQIFEAESKL